MLNRGTVGDLFGEGGRPLTEAEIKELNIFKATSELYLINAAVPLRVKIKEAIDNFIGW
jgi:hypothetical protein